jgi:hypothetical protein
LGWEKLLNKGDQTSCDSNNITETEGSEEKDDALDKA